MNALIGHTGFVGSNLKTQGNFQEFYNSKNIQDIKGKSFDLVVCAGVSAVKWWANQNPSLDQQGIRTLVDNLKEVRVKRFVLISTVDIYPMPVGVNEGTLVSVDEVSPYGRHRLLLEQELSEMFEKIHIIRLPGLFGVGLKKNILFDMLSHNMLEKINPTSSFQWYPLSRIWNDIQIVIKSNIDKVNFAVEPVQTGKIYDEFFANLDLGSDPYPVAEYDMQTNYSNIFGQNNSVYMMSADDVLFEIKNWLKSPQVE